MRNLVGQKGIVLSDFITSLKNYLSNEGVVFKYDKKIEKIERHCEGIYINYRREKFFFDYLIYGYSPYFIQGIIQTMQKSDIDIKTSLKNNPPRDMINFSYEILEELSFFKHLGFLKIICFI